MDIKKLAQVSADGVSNIDLEQTGTNLVTDNVKIKAGNLAGFITFLGLLNAGRTIIMPDKDVDLGDIDLIHEKANDLIELSGVPANSTDLGDFDGSIIPSNLSIKEALQAVEDYLAGLVGNAAVANIEETKYLSGEEIIAGDVVILRGAGTDDPKWFKASSAAIDNPTADLNTGLAYGDSDVVGVAKISTAMADEAITVIMQGEAIVNSEFIDSNNANVYLSDTVKGGAVSMAPDEMGTTVIRLGKVIESGMAGTAKIYLKPNFVGIN